MGAYNSAVITTAGQSLLARAIADNLPFYFTSAKTTEYVVPSGTSAASLTELPNIKQSEEITSATVSGGNQVVTSVRFDNTEITLNYSINTIGVYARVGTDTEETLLAVITAITADVMPSYSAANPVSYVYSINLAISNASNINIIVAPTGAPNYAEFNELSAEVEALDAEVQNARIGADGVTYPTLGDAIRTNDSALKSQIKAVADENLFMKSEATKGQRLTNSGELTPLSSYYTSDYIEVLPNTWYYFNFTLNDMVKVCTYDSNKTFINYYNSGEKSIKAESNARYIRFCDLVENIDTDKMMKREIGFITPEQFGAVGDSVTDDTSAIKDAISFARQNGYILSAISGKVYVISSQIDLSDIDVDFNNATIKTLSTMNYMIKVDSSTRTNPEKPNIIKNMLIDCDNMAGGIEYITCSHDTTDNVNIINCHLCGIAVRAGGGGRFINGYWMGDGTSGSIGIALFTSDCHIQQIIMKDMHNAVINNGTNLFLGVHAWMSGNCEGTTWFTHNGGNCVLMECHFDTYEKAIYRNTDKNLDLIGCVYYINSHLWDASTTPRIIWFLQNNVAYSANVHFANCSFNPLNTEVILTNFAYTRMVFENCFFYDGITGNINNVPMTLSAKVEASEPYTYVRLRQEGKLIKLDAFVTPTSELTTGYIVLMMIPSNYMYPADDSGNGYNARGYAILYLDNLTPTDTMVVGVSVNYSNGAVSANIPTSLDITRVKAIEVNLSYKAKKSLDYYRG